MAKSLEELLAEYSKQQQTYTPLTPVQIQQQAANRYQSVYDQKRQNANQAFQTADQALASQLDSLQSTYDKQREDTAKGYRQTYSTADRQSLARGMQRSSYNNATLANINIAGQEAQQDINEAQAQKAGEIGDQRALYAQQLAQQLAQYGAAQKADELAYIDELTAREYDRAQAQQQLGADLALAIYNAQQQQAALEYQKQQDLLAQQNWQAQFDYQKQQDALAQENWLKEYELAQASKSRSSSSSGGTKPKPDDTSSSGDSSAFDRMMNSLNTGASAVTTPSILPAIASGASVVSNVAYDAAKAVIDKAAKDKATKSLANALAAKSNRYSIANSRLSTKK